MAGGKLLASTLYGVSSLETAAYVVSAGVVLVAGMLGAWGPAGRASRVDPRGAIRGEGKEVGSDS
jgi:ABC-type antimicrobial peptide transport system permease subunit